MILRPGKTPRGVEVRGVEVRGYLRRIRHHWPATRITIRGDGHYASPVNPQPTDNQNLENANVAPQKRALSRRRPSTANRAMNRSR